MSISVTNDPENTQLKHNVIIISKIECVLDKNPFVKLLGIRQLNRVRGDRAIVSQFLISMFVPFLLNTHILTNKEKVKEGKRR